MISLKSQVLRSFDEIANSLRSLDRLEALSKPMVPMASSGTTARAYAVAGEHEDEDHWQDGDYAGEGHQWEVEDFEQHDEWAQSSTGSNKIRFKGREYDEAEAIYVQAYNNVRKDLRTRWKERGFIRHTGNKRKGKSKGDGGDGDSSIKEAELLARARCFRCNELGAPSYKARAPPQQPMFSPSTKATCRRKTPFAGRFSQAFGAVGLRLWWTLQRRTPSRTTLRFRP